MTKKDFNLIAAAINGIDADTVSAEAREAVARALAKALATTNPAFNRDRFLDACSGVNGTR